MLEKTKVRINNTTLLTHSQDLFFVMFLDEGNKINLRAVIPTSLGDDMILLQSELMHFLDVSSTEKLSGLIIKTSILPELRQ